MIPRISRRSLFTSRYLGFWDKRNVTDLIDESEKCEEISKQSSGQRLKDLLNSSATFIDSKYKHDVDKWSTLPYAEGTIMTQSERQELNITRPKIDPQDTSIILFPGQGSQFVGMAKSLEQVPTAKDLFDWASEILKYDLMKLCNGGPKKQLNDLRYSHVAIFTASLGYLEKLKEERPEAVFNCVGTAGFSVGEIASLVFAGSLEFDQALQLVQLRAEAIYMAGEMHKGGMASIFYRPDSKVILACEKAKEHCIKNNIENPECLISNFMFPRYKVLSGNDESLNYIEENLQKFRLGSLKRIKNTPALHCSLMSPAAEEIAKALEHIQVQDPLIRVYSNVHSKPYADAKQIRNFLPKQIEKPVAWEQTMHQIYARRRGTHFPRTFLCGPGLSLKSILRNVNLRAWHSSKQIGDIKTSNR